MGAAAGQEAAGPAAPDVIEGVLDRVAYRADDAGFTVAKLQVDGRAESVTVVGALGEPFAGEPLRLFGAWRMHPQFGRQFEVQRYESVRPSSAAGIERYLGSGLVKGIGPGLAKALVRHLGADTLDVIEQDPARLQSVPGIGPGRATRIRKAWEQQSAVRQVMLFLMSHGVSSAYAARIYRTYGSGAVRAVEANPYRLAHDVHGIGFIKADQIAQHLGFQADHPARIAAGLTYAFSRATEEGHAFLPAQMLLERSTALLKVEAAAVEPVLAQMTVTGQLIRDAALGQDAIYTPGLWEVENALARAVARVAISRSQRPVAPEKVDAWLGHQEIMQGLELSPAQRQAVHLALAHPLMVLTGGPGTGKTTVTNLIVQALEARGLTVSLASPTGRAAKRLAEVTGRSAQTLHRLLRFDPSRQAFAADHANPLDCDVIIVDEASMLDLHLAHALFDAAPDHAKLILVGDADQLPSVGPGSVLADLIATPGIVVCHLDQVFRQAAASLIVLNAHEINQGRMPRLEDARSYREHDCVFIDAQGAEETAQRTVQAAARSLPRLGYPAAGIQVLAPMHRGPAGVAALNEQLQAAVNAAGPAKAEVSRGGRTFRVGDRVMQTVNDHDRQVYNGDTGSITAVNADEKLLTVDFGDGPVEYGQDDLDELQIAYAVSVHKSQGSEFAAVVIALDMSHYMMLQRNLLYTAMTRARRLCVLVGDKRAIARAVRNDQSDNRYGLLRARLLALRDGAK
jgi:exodeoxyribonuclease V alpha subunit